MVTLFIVQEQRGAIQLYNSQAGSFEKQPVHRTRSRQYDWMWDERQNNFTYQKNNIILPIRNINVILTYLHTYIYIFKNILSKTALIFMHRSRFLLKYVKLYRYMTAAVWRSYQTEAEVKVWDKTDF